MQAVAVLNSEFARHLKEMPIGFDSGLLSYYPRISDTCVLIKLFSVKNISGFDQNVCLCIV